MPSVPSSEIVKVVGAASLRKGDAILRRGALLFVHRDGETLHAALSDSKGGATSFVFSLEETGFASRVGLLPPDEKAKLAAAATRLLESETRLAKARPTPPPLYQGLSTKFRDSQRRSDSPPTATLSIHFPGGPPHAPSKWEKRIARVALSAPGKTYAGNLGNIRQLHFHDSVGVSLKISDFPSQARQIIRFLAINAESDGANISLDAETMADLFHCLPGFDNADYGGKMDAGKKKNQPPTPFQSGEIHVRYGTAAIVLADATAGKNSDARTARPVLRTPEGVLPLKNAAAIVGRNGIWVGLAGDYWWVPATEDLNTLRQIIMAGSFGRRLDPDSIALGLKLEISTAKATAEARKRSCAPLYHAETADDGGIAIQLDFVYGTDILPSSGPNIAFSNGKAWKRDSTAEKRFETELIAAGFAKNKNTFELPTPEAAGMFIDTLARKWFHDDGQRVFSAKFATIANAGTGTPPLLCHAGKPIPLEDETNTLAVEISFATAFGRDQALLNWKEVLSLVKKQRRYAEKNGVYFTISEELADFIRATADFASPEKENPGTVAIPKGAEGYWEEKLESLLEAGKQNHSKKEERGNTQKQRPIPGKSGTSSFKGDLRPYQADAVQWARKMFDKGLNVVLADEMGLGKTVQTIALLCSLRDEGALSGPSMVLCPSSLIDNWKAEFAEFAPTVNCHPLKTGAEWQTLEIFEPETVLITSYTMAVRQAKRLKDLQFDLLALDEAQHIKNASTVNAKMAKSLLARQKIALTGTPLENRPEELWSIFDFLHPRALGSLNSFKKRYANVMEDEKARNDLATRTAPFILRRRKAEVEPDLPEKRVQTIPCEMSPEQRNVYDEERWSGLERLKGIRPKDTKSRFDILANLTRLRQICCHPDLLPENAGKGLESAKTELLKELVLESIDGGHKTLVFSQFTSFLSIAAKWLEKEEIPFLRVDGKTKSRQNIVDRFNSPDGPPIFLLSLKVGGIGFNLVSADRVIIYDPWWNPAAESQATDRTHRIGQTKSVHCVKLVVEDSIESKILDLQQKKRDLFKSLVDDHPASLKNLSFEEIQFLLE